MHRLTIAVIVGSFALLNAGCLYLHNDADEKMSRAAKEEFDKLTATSPFTSQTENLAAFRLERANLGELLTRQSAAVRLRTVLSQEWETLSRETSDLRNETLKSRTKLLQNRADAEKDLASQLARLTGAKTARSNALDALNDAAALQSRWHGTQILIGAILEEALKDSGQRQPANAIRNAFATTMPVSGFEERNGRVVTRAPTTQRVATILDISPLVEGAASTQPFALKDLANTFEGTTNVSDLIKRPKLRFADPGLAVTITSLLYDVARVREQRIQAEIAIGRSQINTYNDYSIFLEERIAKLEDDLSADGLGITAALKLRGQNEKTVRETFARLANEVRGAQGDYNRAANEQDKNAAASRLTSSHNRLVALYVSVYANFKSRVIEGGPGETYEDVIASLASEGAARQAALNFTEREAFISRGLEGLMAYHAGGVSSQDIGNIIGVVQTIGIFQIAEKQ